MRQLDHSGRQFVNKGRIVRYKQNRRSFKEEREFEEISHVIEALEAERAKLHKDIADGQLFRHDKTLVKTKLERLEALDLEIEARYARWQELLDLGH